jgi:hypothetical protein
MEDKVPHVQLVSLKPSRLLARQSRARIAETLLKKPEFSHVLIVDMGDVLEPLPTIEARVSIVGFHFFSSP